MTINDELTASRLYAKYVSNHKIVMVRRQFKKGDTIFDILNKERFFMPTTRYQKAGMENRHGSIDGLYELKKLKFHRYQSVLRNCRMVLIEKEYKFRPFTKHKENDVFVGREAMAPDEMAIGNILAGG